MFRRLYIVPVLWVLGCFAVIALFMIPQIVTASGESFTGTSNFTVTQGESLAITDLQISGVDDDTLDINIFVPSGTLAMSTTTDLTFNGADTGNNLSFSGTRSAINSALTALTYTPSSSGNIPLQITIGGLSNSVYDPASHHVYQAVANVWNNWNDAKTAAESVTFQNNNGYLATISSQDEQHIVEHLGKSGWLGGSDSAEEGVWKWVGGPDLNQNFWNGGVDGSAPDGAYANWTSGQPDNYTGSNPAGENCLEMHDSSGTYKWNDQNCDGGVVSNYIVEYGNGVSNPSLTYKDIDIQVDPIPNPVEFNNGDGTELSPYEISNCEQLQGIKYDLSAYYILTQNVDCSMTNPGSESFNAEGIWGDQKGFEPIGDHTDGEQFNGNLNGQTHTVDGLYINRPDENTTGLFGAVELDSTVSSVNLTNLSVTGRQATGGLVGVVYGTVSNSSSSGTVSGSSEVGGLVGGNNGWDTVEDSYSTADVSGETNIGGLVGTNRGNIYRSHATGTVVGDSEIGGLVGASTENTTTANSFATGSVFGMSNVGGLAGIGYNTSIEDSYASGDVEGYVSLGGLIGGTEWSMIDGNYATGDVTSLESGDSYSGGLGGNLIFTYVTNDHASGDVSGPDASYLGGLIGGGVTDIESSYATGGVSGGSFLGGLVGALDCQGAQVTNTFSTGPVTAYDYAGGLAGTIGGGCQIENVYTRSNVESNYWAGGLTSQDVQQTIMNNVYAANTATSQDETAQDFIYNYDPEMVSITNSFFDNELDTNGNATPAIGKSTADMKNIETFTTELGENSWDFETVWSLNPEVNNGYPCLLWDGGSCVDGSIFTQGDGTAENPYVIDNCQKLQAMQEDLAANYALGDNVDCSNSVVWNGGKGFNPVGDSDTPFIGNLDGAGYTVDDLYIQRADDSYNYNADIDEEYVGLFGYTEGSEIKNLELADSKVKGYRYVGGIVGFAKDSNIHDDAFNVDLPDNSCAPGHCVWARWGEYGGGIVGVADNSTLNTLETGGPVKGSGVTIGGIVGEARNGTEIDSVSSSSNIDGGYQIGGIAGTLLESTLTNADAHGFVDAVYDDGFKLGTHAGGAVGYAEESDISDVNAYGDVNGWSSLGGLVGSSEYSTIENSTASGVVDGKESSGGFIGSAYGGTIEDSDSEGDVTGQYQSIGGFIGQAQSAIITSSTASGIVYGDENDSGGVGGFVGYSLCESAFTDSSAIGDVYGNTDVGGFTGFDGCQGPGSTFTESHSEGNVTATGEYAGGFAGIALASNMLRVYATGNVEGGSNYVGGLAGYAWTYRPDDEVSYGVISESYATGNVYAGDSEAGGLVGGLEDGVIEDSYARGDVESSMRAGGLVGKAFGTRDQISRSYATGQPMAGMATGGLISEFQSYPEDHSITNSFWDKDSSHISSTSHDEGIGKTTTEMKNIGTFSDAGWNIDNTWYINSDINDGYPCLQWSDQNCLSPSHDSDGDGVSDAVEDSRPNTGDANNDGTPDRQQDNVVAVNNDLTNKIVVLELSPSCEIQTSSIEDPSEYNQKDESHTYLDGMVHFTADCGSPGVTTDVKLYYYDKTSTNLVLRKFNSQTSTYSTVPNSVIAEETIDSTPITTARYSVTDGQSLDEDGTEDGIIVDPSGVGTPTLQTSSNSSLSSTGMNRIALMITVLSVIASSTVVLAWLYREQQV